MFRGLCQCSVNEYTGQNNGNTVGSLQNDEFKSHTHTTLLHWLHSYNNNYETIGWAGWQQLIKQNVNRNLSQYKAKQKNFLNFIEIASTKVIV